MGRYECPHAIVSTYSFYGVQLFKIEQPDRKKVCKQRRHVFRCNSGATKDGREYFSCGHLCPVKCYIKVLVILNYMDDGLC